MVLVIVIVLTQPEDAFEVDKEHLDLLSKPHRYCVLFGLNYLAGHLVGVFMFFAGDLPGLRIRAALYF